MATLGIRRTSIVMVDSDLYSSAAAALRAVGPLIDRAAIVFFDDWHSNDLAARGLGESRAFDEWLRDQPALRAEPRPHLAYSATSAVFRVRRT